MSIYHEGDILEGIDGFYIVRYDGNQYRACVTCVFHKMSETGCSKRRQYYLNRNETCSKLIGSDENFGIFFSKLEGGL
jgi:hypothetical protein